MGIISDAREIVDLVKKLGDAELYRKIVELEKEIIGLTYEVRELKEKLKLQGEIQWDGRIYWLIKKDSPKDGPYCQLCQDRDQRLTRLQSAADKWYCLGCKSIYPKIAAEITDEGRIIIEKERAGNTSFNSRKKWQF